MTSQADYTEEEWIRLRRAPFVAGLVISIADPGGPIEMAKETIATLKTASTPPSQEELLVAVSQEILSMVDQKQNPMAGFKPDSSALAGKMILDELKGVNEILTVNATPEEADAFRRWLLAVAQAAADGAKEGGFMGFGAELVSRGEQGMLDERRSNAGRGPRGIQVTSIVSTPSILAASRRHDWPEGQEDRSSVEVRAPVVDDGLR